MCGIFPLLFLLCALTVKNGKSDDSSRDNGQSEVPTNESYNTDDKPDLTCIAYGTIGCKITCDVISELYTVSTIAYCNAVKKCECYRPEEVTLRTIWNEKFINDLISKRLLCIIDTDPDLADYISDILHPVPRTPQDTIDEFKKDLPNIKELQKLQPANVEYPSDHFASQPSVLVDKTKHALGQMKIPREEFQKVNISEKITKYLKSELPDPKTYPEVVKTQLCQVNNQVSKEILEKNFPGKKCDKNGIAGIKRYDWVIKVVDSLVIRELTKSVENNQKK